MMKSTVTILLLLLAAWMGASQWVWLCVVKNHCGSGANPAADIATGPAAVSGAVSGPTASPMNGPTTVEASAEPPLPGTEDTIATVAEPNPSPAPVPVDRGPSPGTGEQRPQVPTPAQSGGANPTRLAAASRPISVVLDDQEALSLQGTPVFGAGSWQYPPTSDWIERLTNWLRERSRVDLRIIGEYSAGEINTSDWSDLGLARASELRDRLVAEGIGRRRIELESVQITAGQPGLRLLGEDFAPLFEPLRVYFPSSSARLTTSAELEQYARRAGAFLERHPAAMIRLTGHTDDTGGLQDNYALGLRRAREVAALLDSLGVPPDRMDVASEGESSPEADNDTAGGKALNRRVQLQLISR